VDYDKVIVCIYALDIEAELTIWTKQIPKLNKKDKQRRTKTRNKPTSFKDDEST